MSETPEQVVSVSLYALASGKRGAGFKGTAKSERWAEFSPLGWASANHAAWATRGMET